MELCGWRVCRDRLRRGVEVHGDVKRLVCRKNWPEEWIVVEAAVGGVVDETADEPECGHASVEFFYCFFGVEGR